MGMLCGADIAVARYIIHSIIPAFIGNREYPLHLFPKQSKLKIPAVIGALLREWIDDMAIKVTCIWSDPLVGVPMLYFYHPPELPRFFANQRQLRQDEELTRRVTQLNDRMGGIVSGVSTPTALKAS